MEITVRMTPDELADALRMYFAHRGLVYKDHAFQDDDMLVASVGLQDVRPAPAPAPGIPAAVAVAPAPVGEPVLSLSELRDPGPIIAEDAEREERERMAEIARILAESNRMPDSPAKGDPGKGT